MIVIDTSAVVDLLVETPVNTALIERLRSVTELHAPHLIDIEFLSVLRRLHSRDLVTDRQATIARDKFAKLPIQRYPHTALSNRIWELRHAITPYDASYIALAEALQIPFVTSDGRLARSTGHRATVEHFLR